MEPQIQYATTKDGVSIAYAEAGDGSPIIRLGPPGVTHVQRDWAMWPGFQPLARAFRLIWYDPRGTGLSDRDAVDFTMPSMITDLEAVVEGAGVDSFTLLSFSDSVPIAVTYAATFPERVSH